MNSQYVSFIRAIFHFVYMCILYEYAADDTSTVIPVVQNVMQK